MPIECQCVNYINLTLHILNSDLKTDTFTSITQSTCKSLSIAYIYIYIMRTLFTEQFQMTSYYSLPLAVWDAWNMDVGLYLF